jgi:hypothetical protein
LPAVGVAVIVIASPAPTVQCAALVQWALAFASLTVAVPLPVIAAVIVNVWTKFAVSVCVAAAVNVHGLVLPLQVPPDQLASWLPLAAVAVIVIESPTKTVQCEAFVQWAFRLASLSVAVPLPVVAAVIVTVENIGPSEAMCAPKLSGAVTEAGSAAIRVGVNDGVLSRLATKGRSARAALSRRPPSDAIALR